MATTNVLLINLQTNIYMIFISGNIFVYELPKSKLKYKKCIMPNSLM